MILGDMTHENLGTLEFDVKLCYLLHVFGEFG